jgi:CTP:molybdopterin cytidylyltransferase MocA
VREACGVILAGGHGERFGGPKAFAVLPDGRSFLAACADTLAAAGCAPIVATLPAGATPPDLAGVRALPLPAPGLAMVDSLKVALTSALADETWQVAIVMPVDHPLADAATVRALREHCNLVAVPKHRGKRGHPVAIGRDLAAAIAHGQYPPPATLRDVLHAAGVRDLDVDDPGVVTNCNTPAVLAVAWERRRPSEEER